MKTLPGLNIIYEDNHLIAVNKTNSDLVQSDKTGDISLSEKIKDYLKEKYNKPGNVFVGVIHRIDRPVSGVVLFARTSKALTRMNEKIKNRDIKKSYLAIIANMPKPESGSLKHYIVRNKKQNKSYSHLKKTPDSQEAVLNYQIVDRSDKYYLLEINLITGRHHQIRSQLAKINCPVKGDLKYGFARSNSNGGISLHSHKMSFIHPVSKKYIEIIAIPPNDMLWNYFYQKISK